jgi:hypothetical protein
MSVSDHHRAQLTNWFEEHMGAELGDAMMRTVAPMGWAEMATRRDLQSLEARLDARIDLLEQRLDARIDRVEVRLDSMAATMATKAELYDSQARLQRTLVSWILLSQATVVAAIGVLLGFLR